MKTYKIWLNPKKFIIIEAECPSKAIEKTGQNKIWFIKRIQKKIDKQEGGSL